MDSDDEKESCVSCGGDGNNLNNKKINDIMEVLKSYSIPLSKEEEIYWNNMFNELGMELSSRNVNSLKPLLEIFDKNGCKEFLAIANNLIKMNLIGLSIYWAYEFSNHNLEKFKENIRTYNKEMIEFCNKSASYHECFAGNKKDLPRASLPKDFKEINHPSEHSSNKKESSNQNINQPKSLIKIKPNHLYIVAIILLFYQIFFSK